MTVDALRRYFRNLAAILEQGRGGKEVLDDLSAVDRGLAPFDKMPIKSFADFLEKAQAYDPNAVVGKKPPRPTSSKTTVDIEGIAATIKHLYDTSTRPEVTIDSVEETLKILDGLTGPHLKIVAKAIKADKGLSGKAVSEVREIVKKAVRDMWGSARRVKL